MVKIANKLLAPLLATTFIHAQPEDLSLQVAQLNPLPKDPSSLVIKNPGSGPIEEIRRIIDPKNDAQFDQLKAAIDKLISSDEKIFKSLSETFKEVYAQRLSTMLEEVWFDSASPEQRIERIRIILEKEKALLDERLPYSSAVNIVLCDSAVSQAIRPFGFSNTDRMFENLPINNLTTSLKVQFGLQAVRVGLLSEDVLENTKLSKDLRPVAYSIMLESSTAHLTETAGTVAQQVRKYLDSPSEDSTTKVFAVIWAAADEATALDYMKRESLMKPLPKNLQNGDSLRSEIVSGALALLGAGSLYLLFNRKQREALANRIADSLERRFPFLKGKI